MNTPRSNGSRTDQIAKVQFAEWKLWTPGLLLLIFVLGYGLTGAESGRVTLIRTPDGGIQPQAAVDSQGNVFALYRAASEMVNRDEILLVSRNHGADFEIALAHPWKIASCPMSSASFSEAKAGVLADWETDGKVYFARVNPKTLKVSDPVSSPGGNKRKHPVVAGNAQGEVLLAWTEGTGWQKGGGVAWQLYDKAGNPTSEKGRADGVPVWSLATAFAKPDGNFVIVY